MKGLGILDMRESSCFRGRINSTTKFYLLKLYRYLGNATSQWKLGQDTKKEFKEKAC